MALSLSKLCKNTEKIHDLKLVAGIGGIENTVRWVHMIEDTEVPDFLHGNELIFTTGIANYKESWLLSFVKNLKKNNASGLVINIGPYITDIPPQVIVYCEQNNFPIFTMPWKTRIIDITYEFCRVIINDEKVEQSLTEGFKNLILNPENKDGYIVTLERAGFSNNSKYTVVSFYFKENGKSITEKFIRDNDSKLSKFLRISSQPKAMFMWNKNFTIVYQNISIIDLEDMLKKIQSLMLEDTNVEMHCGISENVKSFIAVSSLYRQSQWATMLCEIKKTNYVFYSQMGVNKILLNIEKKEVLKEYYMENLGVLIDYDKEHGTDLCVSLRKYCEYNGSVFEMSKEAGVHRNTVNYKMKKIKEVLKKELDYQTIMDLMLCFCISDIINYKKG